MSGEKWAFSDSFFCTEGGFFLPVSTFRSRTFFFLTGEKFVKGVKWIQGGKNTPEEQKKVVGLFQNRFLKYKNSKKYRKSSSAEKQIRKYSY
jgi:hypothetical protein